MARIRILPGIALCAAAAMWLTVAPAAAMPSDGQATSPAAGAAANDADTCRRASGDVAMAACTRAIASGRYAGHDLARLHYDRAVEYANKRNYDRAIADFSAAIRLNPTDPDYHNNRGSSWQLKGDYDHAIVDYNEAIRLSPEDPCPLYNRGIAWSSKDENDRAIADFNEAIRLNPNYAAAFYRRG